MGIQALQHFFMWCTIINFGMLLFFFTVLMLAGDLIYRLHNTWFPMSREALNIIIYSFLAIYKIIIIAFNLIPWIALSIIS